MFSNTKYISLPSAKNPKVVLAIGSKIEKINSFKIYNPYSLKAKLLRFVAFYMPYFNITKNNISPFIRFIEKELNTKLISSVYFSSCKYKAVIQLQSKGKIIGYIKYALNKKGNFKIKNEQSALESLNCKGVPQIMGKGVYNNLNYIIIKNVIKKHHNTNLNYQKLNSLLRIFEIKNSHSFLLKNHPRVKQIQRSLIRHNLNKYATTFLKIIETDKRLYKVKSEHGDFTLWNIINNNDLIDFEEFTLTGIDGMDLCHFYFTEQLYLKKHLPAQIIKNTLSSVGLKNKNILFIYLINTIMTRSEFDFDITQYINCINYLKSNYYEI